MPATRVVNIRRSPYDVYIGRGSRFGNPFTHLPLSGTKANIQVATREEAIERYRESFLEWISDPEFKAALLELKGKVLGCYCSPEACHGDVIAQYLDALDNLPRQTAT